MKSRLLALFLTASVFLTLFAGMDLTVYSGRVIVGGTDSATGYRIYYEKDYTNKNIVNILFEYNSDMTGVTIKRCTFSFPTSYGNTLPREIKGIPVTKIDSNAFYRTTTVEEIVLPDTVTHIGENAFENCTALRYITYCGSEDE